MMFESTKTLHLIILHETSLLSLPVFLVALKSISKKWNLCHFLDVHFVVLRAISHNFSEFGAGVDHSVSGIQLTMETGRGLLFFCITIAFISLTLSNVEGRTHFHKKKTKNAKKGTPVSPPSPASPTVPSDPYNPPVAEPCVFDVTSFGAVGDGSNDDTEAFTSAWKAACAVESGVLLAPADHQFTITSTIFSGPCQPGLVFQLDGALVAPNGPDCWPEGDSKNQWLVFYRVDGMTLTGSGTIEGNGEQWWELPCKPHRGPNGSTLPGPCESPALIRFFMSSNLEVSGIRIQNSPQFHMKFDGCTKVLIQDISIDSPALSPNTDGIHIQDSKGVGIYNSLIANGDDCVSIGPGCSGVAIENITCDHGHGISIGSLGVHHSQACVSNIDVNNVYIKNSDNGVRIKTWQGGMGSVAGIKFENIQMKNVKNCIIIDQYYCFTKGCKNESSAVYVTDVSYKYIKGTYDVRTPPVHFACSDSVPCTNITLADIELLPEEGVMVDNPFCWNAYGTLETITIPPIDCLQDGKPETVSESANYNC